MPPFLLLKLNHVFAPINDYSDWQQEFKWMVKSSIQIQKYQFMISLHECSASLLCWREGFLMVAMASGVGMASPGGSWRIMFSWAAGGSLDPLILALVMLYSPESKYLFYKLRKNTSITVCPFLIHVTHYLWKWYYECEWG